VSVRRLATAPAFTAQELAALPTEQWITNGGSIYNQRYSPLDEIRRTMTAASRASG
jgi:hypothetical protein